jgi:type VI secretion system secreted protein Hcp
MAVDMFLTITDIEGESRDSSHAGAIDVLAWSWGASQSGSMHTGGGGGSGRVNVQDISITKWVDKSSPVLMQKCCEGTHLEEAVLIVRKAGGTPLEYFKITMQHVLISSISSGGSGGEDRLTENVSLNFGIIKFEYQPQNDQGEAEGGALTSGWNIMENVPAN